MPSLGQTNRQQNYGASVTLGKGACEFTVEAPVIHDTNGNGTEKTQKYIEQEREIDMMFYRDNFACRPHENLLARDSPCGPLALSIVLDGDHYKSILRSRDGSIRQEIHAVDVPKSWWRKVTKRTATPTSIAAFISPEIPSKCFSLCPTHEEISNDLVTLEEKQIIRCFKFGVGYLKAGQTTEKEMMSNFHDVSSVAYQEFLIFLGDTIRLKGWTGYRAGLDVKNDMTGHFSVYRKWNCYEVMFHVATMLPFDPQDEQQIERKRHLGNDIVILIFQDSDAPFDLSSVTTKQTHVIIVVRKAKEKGYHISVCRRKGVEEFYPLVSRNNLFTADSAGRDFLFRKLISGELASYKSPSFRPKIQRTRNELLLGIVEKHLQATN